MGLLTYDKIRNSWNKVSRNHDGNIPPSFELEVYKKLLNFFHVGDYYYYILNVASAEMEFVSETINAVLGYPSEGHSVNKILENIHPDDWERFVACEQKVSNFFTQLPSDKVLKYKVSYDYRVRCANGKYKWILQQVATIQSSDEGAVIRVLGVHTDITHLKNNDQPAGLSFLGLEGEPSYHNVLLEPALVSQKSLLTKREKEILRLITNSYTSEQISKELFISVDTVNTHRKNLLRKAKCNSPIELVVKSIREGWI